MSLTTTLKVSASAAQSMTLDLGNSSAQVGKTLSTQLADGVGAGQADKAWSDTRTLAASATEDLDLAGALLDALGGSFALARVKGLLIAAAATNTNNVIVGGAATNGFVSWVGAATHTVAVRPGACLALFAGAADAVGYLVTAATADLLRIGNSGAGTSVTYDIVVIGASA